MLLMDHSEQASDDNTQKRKRRPKSYQGCTQCRLARRKCGEGKLSRIPFSPGTSEFLFQKRLIQRREIFYTVSGVMLTC